MAERNNSLEKALAVLDLFQTQRRLTIKLIIEQTGFSSAAVSRILHSLENKNYIYQNRIDGGYYLSDKVYILGRNTNLKQQLVNVLEEPIARLCRRSGFSVSVSIRKGVKSFTAFRKDPHNGLTLIPDVGDVMSLNVTAQGKVLTAFSEDPDKLIDEMEFVRLTKKSLADREKFREVIEEVKSEKLAFDMEEITEGLVCVAVPVLSPDGKAICAISISGYKERMLRELYALITRLQDTAAECERLLN